MDEVIKTEALARTFGGNTAVRSLDIDVKRGEMFGLVGPDGAGKSTAIRLLCGILKPTSGNGRVLGFDLVRQPEEVKKRIGYLSQEFTLYGDLTVDENIEFFAEIHEVSNYKSRRDELLAFTRLAEFRNRFAQNLSGGMKKKLALACTLIHTPELIFLDEPSTGVDPVSRGEFWNILSKLMAEGMSIVLTTPYLDEAERCNRIGLMADGEIRVSGTPSEVKKGAEGKYFTIRCRDLPKAYKKIRESFDAERLILYGDKLNVCETGGSTLRRSVTDMLEKDGFGPVTCEEIEPSLEDVFINMIGNRK